MVPLGNIAFADFNAENEPFTLATLEKDKEGPYLQFYDIFKTERGFLMKDAGQSSRDHQVIPNHATYWAQQGINIVEAVPEPYHRLAELPDLTGFFENVQLENAG